MNNNVMQILKFVIVCAAIVSVLAINRYYSYKEERFNWEVINDMQSDIELIKNKIGINE